MVKKNQKGKVEKTVFSRFETFALLATQRVLGKVNVPDYYYGFNEFFDDSYCVNKVNNKWELSYYERGQNDIIFRSESVEAVCKKLIEKLAPAAEKETAIKQFGDLIRLHKNSQASRTFKPNNLAPATSRLPLYEGDYSKWEDIVKAVSDISGLSYQKSLLAIKALTEIVGMELSKGGKVQLVGFGTFEVTKRAASEGRDPHGGAKKIKKVSNAPKFTPGKKLEDLVK